MVEHVENFFIRIINLLFSISMSWEKSDDDFTNEIRSIERRIYIYGFLSFVLLAIQFSMSYSDPLIPPTNFIDLNYILNNLILFSITPLSAFCVICFSWYFFQYFRNFLRS